MEKKYFDLNIQNILDDWEIYHAVREIIANAVDEKKLTGSKEIEIFKDANSDYHIRDYGRGLNIEHFLQNQSEEKNNTKGIIGKFGIGLKDALAVFNNNNINVQIKSKHGIFAAQKREKANFGKDTLQVVISSHEDSNFEGTEFILSISDDDLLKAKKLFLNFNSHELIESTQFGEIFEKLDSKAGIYINGIKVSEEENFMFDYNITQLTTSIKKDLNRERKNLSRGVYSGAIKNILLASESEIVMQKLVDELKKMGEGNAADEIKDYTDIQARAIQICNAQEHVIFTSGKEVFEWTNDDKEKITNSKRDTIIISERAFDKIKNFKDIEGEEIGTLDKIIKDYQDDFEYDWVSLNDLNAERKSNWDTYTKVMDWLGDKKWRNKIRISKTINKHVSGDTRGVFDPSEDAIIIKEDVLDNKSEFYEVLIHEYIHATTGFPDNNRDFENALGNIIRKMSTELFDNKS